mmetsp:Transcript_20059/g.42819  ORF Transcript_20059/g.42819 Transcript_20059/m.42819 type:complete len:90 (-) Transcript_20059:523-792(-)
MSWRRFAMPPGMRCESAVCKRDDGCTAGGKLDVDAERPAADPLPLRMLLEMVKQLTEPSVLALFTLSREHRSIAISWSNRFDLGANSSR